MQLLAVNDDHLEYVQEHEERTDRLEILGSEEVEMDSTGKLNLKVKNAVGTIYDVQHHLWLKLYMNEWHLLHFPNGPCTVRPLDIFINCSTFQVTTKKPIYNFSLSFPIIILLTFNLILPKTHRLIEFWVEPPSLEFLRTLNRFW